MYKIPTLISTLLIITCGYARAQQSNAGQQSAQPVRPMEANITSPAAMLQFLFPTYKPAPALPAARQMQLQPNAADAKLASARSALETAQKSNPAASAKPATIAIPNQGQQPSTIYTPSVPKK